MNGWNGHSWDCAVRRRRSRAGQRLHGGRVQRLHRSHLTWKYFVSRQFIFIWRDDLPLSEPDLRASSSPRARGTKSTRRAIRKETQRWWRSKALSWRCCRRKSDRSRWRRTGMRGTWIRWRFQTTTAKAQFSFRIPEKKYWEQKLIDARRSTAKRHWIKRKLRRNRTMIMENKSNSYQITQNDEENQEQNQHKAHKWTKYLSLGYISAIRLWDLNFGSDFWIDWKI